MTGTRSLDRGGVVAIGVGHPFEASIPDLQKRVRNVLRRDRSMPLDKGSTSTPEEKDCRGDEVVEVEKELEMKWNSEL
ncbi:unnamed protein product [Dovyalis caffra]|uniref:Uncharacterized protein n=1 Tax=Dovyalis caffra TaxID=77055 RepID=A0AAV1R3N2_9ROSI|nr:unnamed protein product [Dovyalis caffra]